MSFWTEVPGFIARDLPLRPGNVSVELMSGELVPCRIVEDPDVNENGLRQFWAEPVRPVRRDEVRKAHFDVIPACSTIHVCLGHDDEAS